MGIKIALAGNPVRSLNMVVLPQLGFPARAILIAILLKLLSPPKGGHLSNKVS